MILRQGNGKRVRMKNFQQSNPILLFFGCQDALVSAGFLQGGFHLIYADALRIVSDCVGFLEPEFASSRSVFNMLDTIEPIQGCFADIVSGHLKYHLSISISLLIRRDCDHRKEKHKICRNQHHFFDIFISHDRLSYFRCRVSIFRGQYA